MKLSKSFLKTIKQSNNSADISKGTNYLFRASYIHQELAGVYDFLPLGLRTLNNIEEVIRKRLNEIGCEEMKLTALQNAELWQKTDRWDDEKVDIWFKTDLKNKTTLGLAPTHEEPLTNMMRKYIASYKDLPAYVYQFQTKFRNELRAKSGILRTREFLMKDLYSFTVDEATHQDFYKKAEQAYKNVYNDLGIGDSTHETFASGGVFSKFSHEFQTILDIGEDLIWHNEDFSVVLNDEVMTDEILNDLKVKREDLVSKKAAEVGNIFTLGYRFSEALDLNFTDKDGKSRPVYMGCYGIGVSRLLGVIAEKFSDEYGLVWPEAIAPYKYYLIPIGDQAQELANKLHDKNPELILLDDRADVRPGEKFADADLQGIPYRIVISEDTLKDNKCEQKNRQTGEVKLLTIDEFSSKL